MCQSEGDGLILERRIQDLLEQLATAYHKIEMKDRTIAALRQTNAVQSIEIQKLRSAVTVLP